jgi:hypothetical protein
MSAEKKSASVRKKLPKLPTELPKGSEEYREAARVFMVAGQNPFRIRRQRVHRAPSSAL